MSVWSVANVAETIVYVPLFPVDPLTVSAQSVCTPDPVLVGPDDPVSAAVALMRAHAVRRLPVIEDGLPVGMVSLGDLAAVQDPGSALAEISRAVPDGRDAV